VDVRSAGTEAQGNARRGRRMEGTHGHPLWSTAAILPAKCAGADARAVIALGKFSERRSSIDGKGGGARSHLRPDPQEIVIHAGEVDQGALIRCLRRDPLNGAIELEQDAALR